MSPHDFYNPYAFVPNPGRAQAGQDCPPEPLGVFGSDTWTGCLRVRLCAVSPLLVTEQSRGGSVSERRTRVFDGVATIPSTTVKGMLRSEVEMVTNSRFGVFEQDQHARRLGYRASARDGSGLVPVRIVADPGGGRRVLPLNGMAAGRGEVLKAAWVPTYPESPGSIIVAHGIRHGDEVTAWVVLVQRDPHRSRQQPFRYWRVTAMGPAGATLPASGNPVAEARERNHRHEVIDKTQRQIRGWYFRSNQNIGHKHDERVFFADGLDPDDESTWPRTVAVDETVEQMWSDVITSYHDAHDETEIHHRPRGDATAYLGHTPGRTAWSWHLVPTGDKLDELKRLPEGTLCYAEFAGSKVSGLFPVALSRLLYQTSPQKLAELAKIAPAATLNELSPADRLFGWVPRGREEREITRALRGRVRIGPVKPIGDTTIEPQDRPLAILGQPRPTQDLFYAARNPAGDPLTATSGYHNGQGLRGFKVYPHQPNARWTTEGEWASRDNDPGTQNSALRNWIASGSEFEFDLHIDNATDEELGALLYVLCGPEHSARRRYHKLGGGKPLGFGTVAITLDFDESDVRSERSWRCYFGLDNDVEPEMTEAELRRRANDYHSTRQDSPHIKSYEHYLHGFPRQSRVHYPEDPNLDSDAARTDQKRYEWFVANRRRARPITLGRLEKGHSPLPIDPGDDTP